jgi:mRNA-degrading endonuclease RelE of RelBE toxin-antitoxin system
MRISRLRIFCGVTALGEGWANLWSRSGAASRGLRRPQYRLRVDEVRVFYDVSGTTVEILAIVAKLEAESWLAQFGSPE